MLKIPDIVSEIRNVTFLNNLNNEDGYINYYHYTLLRQFSRRKDAPIQLKKQVNRLKILEQRLKDSNKVKNLFFAEISLPLAFGFLNRFFFALTSFTFSCCCW